MSIDIVWFNFNYLFKTCYSILVFSLTIKNRENIKSLMKIDPIYEPGDCTVHHSRSIHYAETVPPNTKRGLVLRMSLFAFNEKQKINHLEWYEKIVKKNRLENLKN